MQAAKQHGTYHPQHTPSPEFLNRLNAERATKPAIRHKQSPATINNGCFFSHEIAAVFIFKKIDDVKNMCG